MPMISCNYQQILQIVPVFWLLAVNILALLSSPWLAFQFSLRNDITQVTFTCLKSIIEALENGVKYIQS